MNHPRVPLLSVLSLLLLWLGMCDGFTPFLRQKSPMHTSARATTTTLRVSSSDDEFMSELRQRIDQEYASYVPIEGATNIKVGNKQRTPDKVHVVVFQAGTIHQGAHTVEYPKGSGNNVVLAFESIEACRKFAASLAQQNFVDPTPRQYRLQELQNYFSTVGVFVQVVPEGVELKPPTQNVPKFGHDPSLCQTKQYLDYLFEMTDDDYNEELEDIGVALETTSSMTIANVVFAEGAWE